MPHMPTPEELGEMLERGEITREEAIEIMDRRAREEAFATMNHAAPMGVPDKAASDEPRPTRRTPWRILAAVMVCVLLLAFVALLLLSLLTNTF